MGWFAGDAVSCVGLRLSFPRSFLDLGRVDVGKRPGLQEQALSRARALESVGFHQRQQRGFPSRFESQQPLSSRREHLALVLAAFQRDNGGCQEASGSETDKHKQGSACQEDKASSGDSASPAGNIQVGGTGVGADTNAPTSSSNQGSGTGGPSGGEVPPKQEDIEVEKFQETILDLISGLNELDILEVIFTSDMSLDTLRMVAYSLLGLMTRTGNAPYFLTDEDGVPLSEAAVYPEAFFQIGRDPRLDEDTVHTVIRSLLGPNNLGSPVVARGSGDLDDYLDTELFSGHIIFCELREGVDAASASLVLSASVRECFPLLRMALIPFPESAVQLSQELSLSPSRRCAVILFRRFTILRVIYLRWLLIFALPAAVLLQKDVTLAIPGLAPDLASFQATALFSAAALLPATASYLGQVACAAKYKRPPPTEFLPILAPGAGIAAIRSMDDRVPESRAVIVDFALASSLSSLAVSLAMVKSASCSASLPLIPLPSLEALGLGNAVSSSLSIPGTVLVPQSILQHSALFNSMADRLSCASLPDPNSTTDVIFALPPLALSGLLGLHLTALCLIPYGNFFGARLVDSLVDDDVIRFLLRFLGVLFVVACLFATGAPSWIVYCVSALLPQLGTGPVFARPTTWDGISSPGLVRALLSTVLVCSSMFLMLPKPLYDWLTAGGLGPQVSELLLVLSSQ